MRENRVQVPSGTATVSAEVSPVDESRSLDRFCSEKARGDLRGASQETCLCYVFTETLQVRRIGLIGAEKRLRHPFGVPRFFLLLTAAHGGDAGSSIRRPPVRPKGREGLSLSRRSRRNPRKKIQKGKRDFFPCFSPFAWCCACSPRHTPTVKTTGPISATAPTTWPSPMRPPPLQR